MILSHGIQNKLQDHIRNFSQYLDEKGRIFGNVSIFLHPPKLWCRVMARKGF